MVTTSTDRNAQPNYMAIEKENTAYFGLSPHKSKSQIIYLHNVIF